MSKDGRAPAPRRRTPHPQRAARTRRAVQIVLLVFAGAVVIDAFVGDRGLVATIRAKREYEQLEATIQRQRAENARLREEVRRLTEDPLAIEEIARRELGLIRRGEKIFIIKDLPQPSAP